MVFCGPLRPWFPFQQRDHYRRKLKKAPGNMDITHCRPITLAGGVAEDASRKTPDNTKAHIFALNRILSEKGAGHDQTWLLANSS